MTVREQVNRGLDSLRFRTARLAHMRFALAASPQYNKHIGRRIAPWTFERLPSCETPGMITEEETKYYYWLGQFFKGIGEAVELGCWLGRSTFFILGGLQRSPSFRGKKL